MKKYNSLSDEEQIIIINKGTEIPNTGKYNHHHEAGIYICRQCDAKLFKSESKFSSGCGWSTN